jgi:hypothetical protein
MLAEIDVGADDSGSGAKTIEPLGDLDAPDARLEAKAFEAKYPSKSDCLVLADFEVGAEESREVIKNLHELDASAESAVETFIAKTETDEAQDVLDKTREAAMNLREQMHAARVRIDGGVKVSADDPLAIDKRRVAKTLKRVGRTSADLPPDFWRLRQTAIFSGERSRRSELYRICAEGEAEQREAERLLESARRGRPANYDLLPVDERKKIDGKIRQQKHRGKRPKPASKPSAAPLPVAQIAGGDLRSTLIAMRKSLEKWVVNYSTPLSRQLRRREKQLAIIRTAAAYSRFYQQYDKLPSHSELAKWLHCSNDQARRRVDLLKSLYAPGGPWTRA